MKSKTAAIKHARKNVGELFKFGDGYKYLSYDEDSNAWRESVSREYNSAMESRASALIQYALEYLGSAEKYVQYQGGHWTDYIQTETSPNQPNQKGNNK